MEKAREIEIKANEEFEIEKSKLVRQETDAIDAQYEKKFKQATMSQQIARSTVANKTRLKVLGARQELLDSIFEDTRKKLAEGAKDKSKYQQVLKGLILEGLYALSEAEAQIRSRKTDADAVKKAIDEAAAEYKKATGQDIKVTLDTETTLPEGMYVLHLSLTVVSQYSNYYLLVLAASSSSEELARSRSTTRSKPDSPCWNTLLPRPSVRSFSARIPTASLPIKYSAALVWSLT